MFRLVSCCTLLLALAGSALAADTPKNVVMIVADDLGFQLGCYGDPDSKTPNLDRLATQGTRFTQAYCTTSSCSASRSVMLTGLYNHQTAHYGHEHAESHFRTYDSIRSLPVMLAEAGYRTCSIGKYHLAPEPVYHFERYGNASSPQAPGKNEGPVQMAENAQAFIAEQDSRPFFLYFCTHEPHRAGAGFGNERSAKGITPVVYDPAKLTLPDWLPDRLEAREEWADYLQAVNRVDQAVGALLRALDQTGHADDTLVLFLSDNGPPFPGAKTTLYQPGMNLPLLVRKPGQKPGVVCEARVNWTNLTPTILDFADVKPKPQPVRGKKNPGSAPLAGRSLLAVLEQPKPEGWNEIFASHTFHEIINYYPMRAVISGRYKYIFNVAHELPYPFASDLYASRTWQAVLKNQDSHYGRRTVEAYVHRPRHELYDLEADPGELNNLASDPKFAGQLQSLQTKVRSWQEQTNDPWASKWVYE
jgi:N-sulfoglucosamine sulfohydrolase